MCIPASLGGRMTIWLRDAETNCLVSTHTHFLTPERTMSKQDRKLLEKDWSRIRGSMQGLQSNGKSFGIMRTAKIKTMGNMGASLQHTFRERETPNADGERLGDNTILVGAATSKEVMAAWHERAPDKIRSNAVHGLEYFIGGSPERMKDMTDAEQDAYFDDALDWIKERHGEDNVLSAVVHRDETTPHMTVMTIPLDDRGKLNARSFVGNKKALSDLQTNFAENVSEKHGLKRGIKGSTARHQRVQRVHGLLKAEGAVELPERLRGSLLRGGKETDEEWRVRASEEATDRVRSLLLEMSDTQRSTDAKFTVANQLIEKLEDLVKVTSDDLNATRTQLTETRDTLLRLKSSLELADMGKDTNDALKAYNQIETRMLDGDLSLLKDAAGSQTKMARIAEIYDRVLPPETPLTDEQKRFERALDTTLDAMAERQTTKQKDTARVEIETHPLPHVRQALQQMTEDRMGIPFATEAERTAFRSEIESSLPDDQVDALRDGNVEVLAPILGDWLDEADQHRLALSYYTHADVEVSNEVLRGVIDRLADLENNETHTHQERGPIH